MKCFYTIDERTGKKVFIPMCFGTIYSENKEDCCCPDPVTEYHFEKERFNKVIAEKNKSIEALQSELNHLRKAIKKLTNKNLS